MPCPPIVVSYRKRSGMSRSGLVAVASDGTSSTAHTPRDHDARSALSSASVDQLDLLKIILDAKQATGEDSMQPTAATSRKEARGTLLQDASRVERVPRSLVEAGEAEFAPPMASRDTDALLEDTVFDERALERAQGRRRSGRVSKLPHSLASRWGATSSEHNGCADGISVAPEPSVAKETGAPQMEETFPYGDRAAPLKTVTESREQVEQAAGADSKPSPSRMGGSAEEEAAWRAQDMAAWRKAKGGVRGLNGKVAKNAVQRGNNSVRATALPVQTTPLENLQSHHRPQSSEFEMERRQPVLKEQQDPEIDEAAAEQRVAATAKPAHTDVASSPRHPRASTVRSAAFEAQLLEVIGISTQNAGVHKLTMSPNRNGDRGCMNVTVSPDTNAEHDDATSSSRSPELRSDMEHTELPPKASSESHLEAQILGLYLDRAALREASQMAKQRNLPNLPPDPRERKMPGGGQGPVHAAWQDLVDSHLKSTPQDDSSECTASDEIESKEEPEVCRRKVDKVVPRGNPVQRGDTWMLSSEASTSESAPEQLPNPTSQETRKPMQRKNVHAPCSKDGPKDDSWKVLTWLNEASPFSAQRSRPKTLSSDHNRDKPQSSHRVVTWMDSAGKQESTQNIGSSCKLAQKSNKADKTVTKADKVDTVKVHHGSESPAAPSLKRPDQDDADPWIARWMQKETTDVATSSHPNCAGVEEKLIDSLSARWLQ